MVCYGLRLGARKGLTMLCVDEHQTLRFNRAPFGSLALPPSKGNNSIPHRSRLIR